MLRKKERLFKKQWEFSIFHLKMLQVINLKKTYEETKALGVKNDTLTH